MYGNVVKNPTLPPDAARLVDVAERGMVTNMGGDAKVQQAIDFARTLPPDQRASYQRRLDDPATAAGAVDELRYLANQSGQ